MMFSLSMPSFFCKIASSAPKRVSFEYERFLTDLMQNHDGLVFFVNQIEQLFLFLPTLKQIVGLGIGQMLQTCLLLVLG
jgi:hypothetical protein